MRNKTIISKRDLDAMIRMHVVNAGSPCDRVSPMPIVWKPRARSTCNWTIPGWTGHSESVRKCMDRINAQLRQLRRAYDIPEEQ